MKIKLLLLLLISYGANAQNDSTKKTKIDTTKVVTLQGVSIIKKKKAVEHLADRTIYDFSEQPILNSGSMLEGLKKIPGVIASESVDVMYQGKSLEVYMDGRPLRIRGNSLISFLEGLPANSIDRIEIITNPGAEYAATSNNAILNIISSRKTSNYTTLTYSGNYSFSDYNMFRNKTNNSIFYASKFKNINWKINFGQSYKESWLNSEIINLISLDNNKTLQYNFLRPNLTYNFKNAKLTIDYSLNYTNSDNYINDNAVYKRTKNKVSRNEIATVFQQFYNKNQKKLKAEFVYSNVNDKFSQKNIQSENTSKNDNYSLSVDYSAPFKFLDKSKASIGGRDDLEDIGIQNNGISSLDFKRNTFSSYAELQTSYKKIDLIMGVRGEKYYNLGKFSKDEIVFNKFKIFPNASIQYNLMNSVFFTAKYNKKISLPSVSNLNPNNVIFENSNLSYNGNPYLQPTIYDNYAIKFSAFDYANLSYDISHAKNDIIFLITKNGNNVDYHYQNAPDLTIYSFSAGVPLPLMLFTKGLKELMKFNFDINKIDIFYFYVAYEKYKSSLIEDQKGIWTYFVSSQFILPKDINLQAIYKIINTGNYKYYMVDKPFENNLYISISKKFVGDKFSISIYGNDVLNTNRTYVRTIPLLNGITTNQKMDSRNFGISLNYKIFNSKKGEKNTDKQQEVNPADKDILKLK